jgi:nucleotide-binding universal stress UspA family protein
MNSSDGSDTMQPAAVRVVLCAVDFSNATRATVARAIDLARRHGLEQVHLVHVAEIVRRDGDEEEARSLGDWIVHEEIAATQTRHAAETFAREGAFGVVPVFRTGIAWREIVECARTLGAGFLVVGARGPESASAPGASIVEQLVRESPCTVVAVRDRAP